MWSPNGVTRNRVSPILNGHTRYDSDVKSAKSASGIQIDIEKNGHIPSSSSNKLTNLIRRRKYDKLHVDNAGHLMLDTSEGQGKRTPHISERRRQNKLFEKPVKPVKGCDAWKYHQKQNWRKFKISLKETGYKLELWRSWFKRIEGHQGTGVLSYFVFLKWMFFLNLYLFLIMFWFVVFPPIVFNAESTYTTDVTGTSVSGVSTTNTATCTSEYDTSLVYSTSGARVVQDFIQGTGWMEKTALFYGWYPAKEINITSSNEYLMPFAYFMAVLGVLFFSLVRMARFTIRSFKENLAQDNQKDKVDYCNKVFGGWDYALDDENTGHGKKNSIYNDIIANLDHQKYLLTRSEWTTGQKCKTYTIRVVINILILAILGGAGYLIYYVNTWATDYLATEASSGSVVILLVEFLPSLTITFLNVIIPLLFEVLVKAEDYTAEFVIKITLVRTVFLKLASLTVLMISLYIQISCSTKTANCNVCSTIYCWETYVGQTLYKLVVLDFLVHIIVIFCYELPRKLCTTKCSCGVCAKIGPAEFDIAKSVLDLVYTQALCWIGFLYCPLLPALAMISTFTQFYLKLFSALYTTVPPEKPYKASKSNNFFMIVLMITFFLCCFPVGYSMVKITPSKGCGPFRIYSDMSVSVDTTISNFPDGLKTAIDILTSTSMIVSILTILCLTIYYLYVRGKAHNERAEVMKEQLVMEGKDKQFLLAKMHDITGEPKQKPKKHQPPPPPTVNTVNEAEDYNEEYLAKTKHFIQDDVPPPPAYEEKITEEKQPTPPPPEVEDDWDEAPIILAVTSPQTQSTPNRPKSSSPEHFELQKRKSKKSKVTPRVEKNEQPTNMPFDF
ncbi:transmembrane channel-like protein 7 isoform X5 [Mytilus edulis]|uniref:transmembrane channel-like protein 7 isoform X5 n=1 Tax=Mytilus edulis TaxID=6550 RepID=UPI0039EE2DC9